jgi:hypothetical protein
MGSLAVDIALAKGSISAEKAEEIRALLKGALKGGLT